MKPPLYKVLFLAGCLLTLLAGCAATAGTGADAMSARTSQESARDAAQTAAAARSPAFPGLGARLVGQYILPAAQRLRTSTDALQTAVGTYCKNPADAAARTRVEASLGDVVDAWARMDFLRFGPLVEQNRLEQFFFWPDPRGVVQRQMRGVLAAADAGLLALPGLQAQSVAVQGIPALEYALYADDAPRLIAAGGGAGEFRCRYAGAVAANLSRLASEMADGWNASAPLAREFITPAASNTVYRSDAEVATEVLKALSTALHVARDQKLQPALGETLQQARGPLLPLHRSALTSRFLASGAQALIDFHVASALGTRLPEDSAWIDAGIREELQRVQQDLASLQMPAGQAVADADQRDLLVHAALLLANVRAIVDEYFAPALGVNLGFNSLDGD